MAKPTLLLPGKLRPPTKVSPEEEEEYKKWIPMEYIMEWFKQRMGKPGVENRVLILKSETASGKSTALPPQIYNTFLRNGEKDMICTQPRVLTAIGNVNTILEHNPLELGKQIGWYTKNNKVRTVTPALISSTVGTLTEQLKLMSDIEIRQKYQFILIDEAHERDLPTDMGIFMLRNFIMRNADQVDCPFIVFMSATFNPEPFLQYFGLEIRHNFIWCVGETAGFDEKWDWNEGRATNNIINSTAQIVEKICTEDGINDDPRQSDILIFMPGIQQIKDTEKVLIALNEKLARTSPKDVFLLLVMNSEAVKKNNQDYMAMKNNETQLFANVLGRSYPSRRRVIISTNVAETGLTLPFLKYSIDAGLNKGVEYEPLNGISAIITTPAPKSRIKQRRGRVGRKFRGVFYPLYPKYVYDSLPEDQLPQILTENINTIILEIINQQLQVAGDSDFIDLNQLNMLTSPAPAALAECVEKMYEIGLIEPIIEQKNKIMRFKITPMGLAALKIDSLPFEAVRAILSAWYWGIWPIDMITIVTFMLSGFRATKATVFAYNDLFGKDGMSLQSLLADQLIDGLVIFTSLQKHIDDLDNWCNKTGLKTPDVLEFLQTREDFIEKFITQEFNMRVNKENAFNFNVSRTDSTGGLSAAETPITSKLLEIFSRLKQCIYDGWRSNVLKYKDGKYVTRRGVQIDHIFKDKNDKIYFPQHFIASRLTLKQKKRVFLSYDIAPVFTSVLDGWIAVDPNFN